MTSPAGLAPISIDPSRLRLDLPEAPIETAPENGPGTALGTVIGTLLGTRCLDCSILVFGRAVFCQACTSANLAPADLSRTGVLYSYTVVRVPPNGWPGPVPYFLGEVELPEGPHVLAEVIGVAEDALRIGMDVELALQQVQTGESDRPRIVYKWTPRNQT